jgi:hypothetical protein
MTEYTTSSEAIREFLWSRERTARWVHQHYGHDTELLSPSVPPSIISDDDALSYGPSESEESSHSTPPRMILRWNDGRPDIPVGGSSNYARSRSQSHPHPFSHRAGSLDDAPPLPPVGVNGFHPSAPSHHLSAALVPSTHSRYGQTPSYASGPFVTPPGQAHITPPPSPEHIVVLPSPQDENPPVGGTVPTGYSHVPPSHHGSQHSSRNPTVRSVQHPQPGRTNGAYSSVTAQQSAIHAPSPRHAYNPSHTSRNATHSPDLSYSQSQPVPAAHGGAPSRPGTVLPYVYSPPAIVYAPSGRHGSHYTPPQIVYSPSSHPQRIQAHGQAPSIAYSQSDPLPLTHSYHGMTTAPPGPRIMVNTSKHGSQGARSHSHARSRSHSLSTSRHGRGQRHHSPSRSPSRSPSPSEAGSRTSGSTYYVLPTPGQKVQIIVSSVLLYQKYPVLTCPGCMECSNRARRPCAPRRLPRKRLRPRPTRPTPRTPRSRSSSASSTSPSSPLRWIRAVLLVPPVGSFAEGTPFKSGRLSGNTRESGRREGKDGKSSRPRVRYSSQICEWSDRSTALKFNLGNTHLLILLGR